MKYRLYKPTYRAKDGGEKREAAVFHVAFKDHMNRRQHVAGTRNEQDSHQIAGKVAELVRCRKSGEILPTSLSKWLSILSDRLRKRLESMDLIDAAAASAEKPLLHHLDGVLDGETVIDPGYKQALAARGNTTPHVNLTTDRVRRILKNCGFNYWRDLNKPGAATLVEVYLGNRRAKGEITGASVNYYIRELRGFCRWMAKTGRAPAMAMDSLAKVKNADVDKIVNRALSVPEMRRLTRAAAAAGLKLKMTGEERAFLYRFCFETGIRPGEARELKVSDFNLKADPPYVTSQAINVKRGRTHVQTLRPALAVELSRLFKTKLPTAEAMKMPSKYAMARMLRHDLALARVEWIKEAKTDGEREQRQRDDFLQAVNHAKERAVFYSVRHAHGTALADAGVPEKDISASMHHTNRTTTARYLHADRQSLSRAIGAMPDMSYPQRQVATGTHGSEPFQPGQDLRRTCATANPPMDSHGENGVDDTESQMTEDTGTCEKNAVESGDDRAWRKGRRYGLKIRSSDSADPEKQVVSENTPPDLRQTCAADCPAPHPDPDLAAIVDAWPSLPADVRKMIAGVVRLTPKRDDGH